MQTWFFSAPIASRTDQRSIRRDRPVLRACLKIVLPPLSSPISHRQPEQQSPSAIPSRIYHSFLLLFAASTTSHHCFSTPVHASGLSWKRSKMFVVSIGPYELRACVRFVTNTACGSTGPPRLCEPTFRVWRSSVIQSKTKRAKRYRIQEKAGAYCMDGVE